MLAGERVRLRALEPRDLERWRGWVNDPEIAAFVDRVLPVSPPEHESFFERWVVGNEHAVWFAIEGSEGSGYLGNAWLWGIDHRHRRAEVRIIIGERSAWGHGVGSEALQLLSDYAFGKLGLHKLFAYVMARNPRARGAFLKSGFREEARLTEEVFWDGRFEDVWRFARLAQGFHRCSDI
ncbi:MAG TPA: GNAT family protein [Candidatus Dormibacteraeota bacterium]|nr:GNAT family protein [Candidatus Dormibacteraeota bacterium]